VSTAPGPDHDEHGFSTCAVCTAIETRDDQMLAYTYPREAEEVADFLRIIETVVERAGPDGPIEEDMHDAFEGFITHNRFLAGGCVSYTHATTDTIALAYLRAIAAMAARLAGDHARVGEILAMSDEALDAMAEDEYTLAFLAGKYEDGEVYG
jgi:hypothetical protein